MKYVLMFILLGGNYMYCMEEKKISELSNKKQSHNDYYSRVVAGVEQKYLEKKLLDDSTPFQIVGFLKTLHDGSWHKVDGFILRSKL